jgi:hypothetical protein
MECGCRPKDRGLGIQDLEAKNTTLLKNSYINFLPRKGYGKLSREEHMWA